ncbi:hypothetical protein AURDEDRAFT_163530 [Auricularia subglabra TFB-10046 SS5]|nr:hypothetical protein AURDEDRAFT_163530 [Auricularia subglabra TFB-10046 SS5]
MMVDNAVDIESLINTFDDDQLTPEEREYQAFLLMREQVMNYETTGHSPPYKPRACSARFAGSLRILTSNHHHGPQVYSRCFVAAEGGPQRRIPWCLVRVVAHVVVVAGAAHGACLPPVELGEVRVEDRQSNAAMSARVTSGTAVKPS